MPLLVASGTVFAAIVVEALTVPYVVAVAGGTKVLRLPFNPAGETARVASVPVAVSAVVAISIIPERSAVAVLLAKPAGVTAIVAAVPVCVSADVASRVAPTLLSVAAQPDKAPLLSPKGATPAAAVVEALTVPYVEGVAMLSSAVFSMPLASMSITQYVPAVSLAGALTVPLGPLALLHQYSAPFCDVKQGGS